MSVPSRFSSSWRGALPGRKPGMRTSRASFLNAASRSLSNSSAGTVMCNLTLVAGVPVVTTPSGTSLSSPWSWPWSWSCSVSSLGGAGSTVLCIRTVECSEGDDRHDASFYSRRMGSIDKGVTHVALPVTDLDASLAFYEKYAAMQVVHRRDDPGGNAVAWISD